jgi:hypothetical protein
MHNFPRTALRLRGEGRGEGLVRLPEHRQVREIAFYRAGRIGWAGSARK